MCLLSWWPYQEGLTLIMVFLEVEWKGILLKSYFLCVGRRVLGQVTKKSNLSHINSCGSSLTS